MSANNEATKKCTGVSIQHRRLLQWRGPNPFSLLHVSLLALTLLCAISRLQAQITPSADAYTNNAVPTANYGAKTLLDVESSQTTYIQFNLSSVPAGYTGADVTKATLKLYVNSVTTAGSFNVDYVNGTWAENTITANNAPALGTTIAASVPLTTTEKHQYVLVDITTAVQAWLNGTPNDGIALVGNSPLNATFDSKENTTTSHSAELDIVFVSGNGTITGVNTAAGSGLTGGGNSGSLNLSLITSCGSGQILVWSGSAWNCSTVKGTGTVTSVGSGLGLTGGPITTSGTLSVDTTKVPLLAASNTFTTNQSIIPSGGSDGLDALLAVPGYTAVYALNLSTSGASSGVVGATESASGYGVYGANSAAGGTGLYGTSANGYGVFGRDSGNGYGVDGVGSTGVVGSSACCGPAGLFQGYNAPAGTGKGGTDGLDTYGGSGDPNLILSTGGAGVTAFGGVGFVDGPGGWFAGGNSGIGGDGVDAFAPNGIGFAGYFSGNLSVTGAITAGTKDFKIDHPLDPANKYLVHASVESSEMMNIYTGNVTTDASGNATVELPEWFQTLNTDFRYQLTVIGQFAQAIIARKIENNQFSIKTNAPSVEVSWQVTGVRQDAFAKAHPLVVEEEKDARLKGFYLHPDLYGAPEEKQIEWARHPDMMKRMKEQREAPRPVIAIPALPAGAAVPTIPGALLVNLETHK